VVCTFDTAFGPMVLVLVGATIVGSMATTWHGVVNPPRPGRIQTWDYEAKAPVFEQGQEMGRFLLGSTVVLLWPEGAMQFNPGWTPTKPVVLGEAMGQKAA
jgi:phosphatidylserine decarboxylase